jgi:hypothetical protein
LVQVYLPAIAGYVPAQMVQAISAFLEFCYLVRRSIITAATIRQIEDALSKFHEHQEIFVTSGVRPAGFCLPRQHSLKHYVHSIHLYGPPNGLCSSITESKHIKAIKEPWRRSSHFEALGQMLLTNQRLDKLAASQVDFAARGMLDGPCLPANLEVPLEPIIQEADDDSDELVGPRISNRVFLAKDPGEYCLRLPDKYTHTLLYST